MGNNVTAKRAICGKKSDKKVKGNLIVFAGRGVASLKLT